MLRCNVGFPQVLGLLTQSKTPIHWIDGANGAVASLDFARVLGLSV
jgi:hypothetical protein